MSERSPTNDPAAAGGHGLPLRAGRLRSARRLPAAAAACLLLAGAAAGVLPTAAAAQPAATPAAAETADDPVHPFYAQLLQDGVYAYQERDYPTAVTDLRLAVFGLLDAPPRLVRGLVYLALAQTAAGEAERAEATVQRVLALEKGFEVYAAAELPAAERIAFEELLVARVSEAALGQVPAFRRVADAKFLARLAGLAPPERRRALAEKVAAVPDEPRWLLALAELELEERDYPAAAAHAARVVALADRADPAETVVARCVRGRALAATGGCAAAVADLDACPAGRTEVDTAAALLECRMTLGQWREAQALLDALPPSVAAARPVARHRRQVARQVARLPEEPPAAAPPEAMAGAAAGAGPQPAMRPGAPSGPAANGASSSPAPAALPADARGKLARARSLLASANRASELEDPLRLAREVADGHPGSVEAQHLAAEIAYRASRWEEAARYFRRGGEPTQPEMQFYMAVALFESGEQAAARPLLERALPSLPRTPFVDGYAERILGGPPAGSAGDR